MHRTVKIASYQHFANNWIGEEKTEQLSLTIAL